MWLVSSRRQGRFGAVALDTGRGAICGLRRRHVIANVSLGRRRGGGATSIGAKHSWIGAQRAAIIETRFVARGEKRLAINLN